jgi:hypothetical protein
VVADGVNGWSLEDYTWDPKTGVGTYTYERREDDGSTTIFATKKAQPYHPSHTGWFMISRYI